MRKKFKKNEENRMEWLCSTTTRSNHKPLQIEKNDSTFIFMHTSI